MCDKTIKVLLVEDDEDDYVMTREMLAEIKGRKFDLMWVALYQEALDAILRNDHDICLIDYRLGEHDGVEFLRVSRARGCKIPAILLTGQGDDQVDIKAMKAGASDYLVKDHLNTGLLERSIRYAIERSLTLEALRKSEKKYRRIVETTSEGVWTLDAEARVNYVNRRMTEMLGYTAKEMLGRPYFDFINEGNRVHAAERLNRRAQGKAEQYELQLRPRDGGSLWVRVSGNPMFDENGEFIGSLGLITDINARRQAERELKQSEATFRGLFANALDAALIADNTGACVDANSSAGELFGVSEADLIGRSIRDFIEPCQSGDIAGKWQEFLADGSMKGVMRVRRPDGMSVDVDYSAKANILPGRHLSVLRDITEQKRIEEALREADRRAIYEYALLLDRIAALAQALGTARELPVIYRALQDFSVASVPCCGIFISLYDQKRNERQAVYAWSEGEDVDLTDLPSMPMNESPHSRAVATGQVIITDDFQAATVGLPVHDVGLEKDPRRPQSSLAVPMAVMGRIVGAIETQSPEPAAYTQEHATALRMAANMAANAIENVQLIERERRQGEQLRQAQKMEAVGHLAGGVAHDFNNLLTVINGYSDLALKRAESEPLRRQLEEIRKAGERASSLTRQLLAFSRKQVLQPEPLNLNDVVAGTIKMLHRLIGEDIEITTALKPDLGQVKADPGQIEQVLMNLVVNARDAMPGGGRISIRTENVEMNEGVAKMYESVRAGAHVRLTVSDTGCGMDAETKSHIFEPFFTTKEVGKGTGLGLSTVYGIVKQSDGYISVYSEEGHGTSFKIYLPRIEDDIEVEKSIAKESPRGDETVLLVEDDELLIKIAHTILEERGYTVLAASSGTEALRICREHRGAIGLMLTDLVMPQMSGKELAVRAAALRPEMKTLYMSGYTDEVVVHHGVLEEGIAFLEKPFTPETLARKVRETLDAAD